jgi:ketosteroid isomerase-like protein
VGGKANITDWLTDMHAKNKGNQLTYQLDRKVENVFGDFVIVLYDASITWRKPDGSIASQTTAKLTHTWMKTEKGWLIIGGMGANK